MYSHLGRYEIREKLGRGAMGVVYKAYDPLIERFVAIKTINLNILSETEKGEYKARFFREAKAAGLLSHNNIVSIYDLGETDEIAYIAMELMEGRELQEYLGGDRRFTIEETLNIVIQVADALYFAHRKGIVHLDIKPSNIMLIGNNHIKIADFGIARMISAEFTQRGLILGTPSYMSPEQFTGGEIDLRSDIYSLGVTLYQMLTGVLPFTGDTPNSIMLQTLRIVPPLPSTLNAEVNETLDRVVAKCLQKHPAKRYNNAKELADDLRRCLDLVSRSKVGTGEPHVSSKYFDTFKRLVIPDAAPKHLVLAGGYLFITLLFLVDKLTNASMQMHMLYFVPVVLIGLHSARPVHVYAAVAMVLLFESLTFFGDASIPAYAKVLLAAFVLPANVFIAFITRVARKNYLEVVHLSTIDGLTGLHNRLSFEAILDLEIERQKEHGGVLSLVFIKIDKINIFNETSRAYNIDELLRNIARLIRENAKQFDSTSRTGSSEFAILMPNSDAAYCESFCRQLSDKLSIQMPETSSTFPALVGSVSFDHAPSSVFEVFYRIEGAVQRLRGSQENAQLPIYCEVKFEPVIAGQKHL
jgi:eukaryotic-like serine/threonine-protein kinase